MAFKEFFLTDLVSATRAFAKGMAYEKYGLPGWRVEMIRRKMSINEANENLTIIVTAIREFRQ